MSEHPERIEYSNRLDMEWVDWNQGVDIDDVRGQVDETDVSYIYIPKRFVIKKYLEELKNRFPNIISEMALLTFSDSIPRTEIISNISLYPIPFQVVFVGMTKGDYKEWPKTHRGHANVFFIDHRDKTIHIFEPLGTWHGVPFSDVRDDAVEFLRRSLNIDKYRLRYSETCPPLGPQFFEENTKTPNNGYCMIWCCMFIAYAVFNQNLGFKEIFELMINRFETNELSNRIKLFAKKIIQCSSNPSIFEECIGKAFVNINPIFQTRGQKLIADVNEELRKKRPKLPKLKYFLAQINDEKDIKYFISTLQKPIDHS